MSTVLILGAIGVAVIGVYMYCKRSGKCSLQAITQSLPIPGGGNTIAAGNALFNQGITNTQGTTGPQKSSLGPSDPNCSGGKSGYIGPGGEIIACGKYAADAQAFRGGINQSGLTIDPNRLSLTENKYK